MQSFQSPASIALGTMAKNCLGRWHSPGSWLYLLFTLKNYILDPSQCMNRCVVILKGWYDLFCFDLMLSVKLDGEAPLITDPPPTSFTILTKKYKKVTCAM